MRNSMVSNLIRVVDIGRGEFKIVANDGIREGTIVEVCPVVPIPSRLAITIGKSLPWTDGRLIVDRAVIDKEYEVFAELGEMELERRLNSGQISADDYSKILSSKVDVNALLDAKSHVIPLGYGLLYRVSEFPNLVREYDSASKLCVFRAVQYIQAGSELTYSN